jgi:hypothetical protein
MKDIGTLFKQKRHIFYNFNNPGLYENLLEIAST